MAWWDKPRSGRRVGLGAMVALGTANVVLILSGPGPLGRLDALGLVAFGGGAALALYQLIAERRRPQS